MKRLLTYSSAALVATLAAVFCFNLAHRGFKEMGPYFKPVIPQVMKDGSVKFIAPQDADAAVGVNINTQPAATGTAGGTATCNWNLAPYCRVSATYGAGFIAFSNPVDGSQYTLEVDQDSTGRTETLPTGTPAIYWPGTTTGLTLSSTASNVEVIQMVYNAAGGNYIVTSVANNMTVGGNLTTTGQISNGCSGTANPGAAVTGIATVTNSCLSGASIVACSNVGPAGTPGAAGQQAPNCTVSSGTLTILVTAISVATPTVAWYRIK